MECQEYIHSDSDEFDSDECKTYYCQVKPFENGAHLGNHYTVIKGGIGVAWPNIEDRTPTETTDNAATETPSSGPSLVLMVKAETLREVTNTCYSALEMLCLKQASRFDQMNASISLQHCSQEGSMSATISITTLL